MYLLFFKYLQKGLSPSTITLMVVHNKVFCIITRHPYQEGILCLPPVDILGYVERVHGNNRQYPAMFMPQRPKVRGHHILPLSLHLTIYKSAYRIHVLSV